MRSKRHLHEVARLALAITILVCAAVCVFPGVAFGQTDIWMGPSGMGGAGSWSDASNWSAGVPTSSSNVFIDSSLPLASPVTLDLTGTINNLTIDSDDSLNFNNNTSLTIDGSSISNASAITLNSTGLATELIIGSANVTLSGTGTVTLGNNSRNIIVGTASGNKLTNQQTIQGSGNIGNGQMTLVNSGTINANNPANALFIETSGGTTNTGTVEATGGATLVVLGGTFTNTGGTVQATGGSVLELSGGTFTNTGGTVQATGTGSTVQVNSGVTITNGTLTTSSGGLIHNTNTATLNNVTLSTGSSFSADNGTVTTLVRTLTNNGAFTLNSAGSTTELFISGNVTLNGKGTLVMSNNSENFILGASTGNEILTNNSTIQGSGNIGDFFMGLVNGTGGKITANQSTPLTIDVSTANFNNKGTLTVNSGDKMIITGPDGSFLNFTSSNNTLTGGTYSVSGTLQFDGAAIATNAANITLNGTSSAITNQSGVDALAGIFATNASTGTFTLKGNRNLTTANSAFTNAGTMTVSKGSTFTVGGTSSSNNFNETAGKVTIDGLLVTPSGAIIDVTGGTIQGSGTFSSNFSLGNTSGAAATFNIGDSSTKSALVKVTGAYTQLATGAMDVQIGGTTAGTKYSQLAVTGAATLAGTLNIALISGFTPTVGSTFTIMTYASHGTTQFTTVNGLAINSTEHLTVTYNTTSIVLTVVSGPCCTPTGLPVDHNPLDAATPNGPKNGGFLHRVPTGKNPAFHADHNPGEFTGAAVMATHPVAAPSRHGGDSLVRFADHNPSQFDSEKFSPPPNWSAVSPRSGHNWQTRFADHNLQQPSAGWASAPRALKAPLVRMAGANFTRRR